MALAQAEIEDPLYNLRLSIRENTVPILTTSADPAPTDAVTDLAAATHISFNVNEAHRTFSLTSPTRFAPDSKPIDLRSCYT
jgi:parafibromin